MFLTKLIIEDFIQFLDNLIFLTCVDERNQQERVEEEVDSHHTVDLPQNCSKPCSVILDSSIVNIPVSEGEGNVGVLHSVENHVQEV